jgi:hypothetical protein
MTVPFNFATQSGNIPLSELDANFANVSTHTLTATYVTGNNQPNITNVGALNSLSVYGNVNTGNVFTNGIVRANLLIGVNYTGTNVSVTGNIKAGNITTEGVWQAAIISAPGNIIGGNLITAGYVSALGNVIASNVQTPNLAVAHIYSDDSSYVTVSDGLDVNGDLISESLTVTNNATINSLTVIGNTQTGNLLTDGLISATGTLTIGGDSVIDGNLTVNGNITYINSNVITINDKSITLANNQSTAANVDGAGIDIGTPTIAYWQFNNATTSWQSNIGITPASNGVLNLGGSSNYWGNAFVNTAYVTGVASAVGGGSTVGTRSTLAVDSAFGSSDSEDPASAQAVRGRVTGSNLTNTRNYITGVTGQYLVTGTNASEFVKTGVLGVVGDQTTTADAAVVAYLDGDGGLTTAGAAYAVSMKNSTPGSGFDYGVDLQWLDLNLPGMTAPFKQADIRFNNGVELVANTTNAVSIDANVALGSLAVTGNNSAGNLIVANGRANITGVASAVGGGSTVGVRSVLTVDSTFGSNDPNDPASAQAVRGRVTGSNLTGTNNYLTGVTGQYLVTGTNASKFLKTGVLGVVGDQTTTADAAVIAYLDGDGGLTTAGAAYGVSMNNSTPGSGFNYGLDLKWANLGLSGQDVPFKQADIRFNNGVTLVANVANTVSINANVTLGTVSATTLTGTLTTSAQPNITSVGTLTSLTTGANANINAGGEVVIVNYNQHGGPGYAGMITMSTSQSGATTPNKYIRLNNTGNLQIVNSAYSGTIFDLSDSGALKSLSSVSASGNITGGNLVGNTVAVNFIKGDTSSYVIVEDGLEVHGGVDIIGDITATGNVMGGYLETQGLVSAVGGIRSSGNIYAVQTLRTGGAVSALGNVTGGNIITNTAGAVITAPTALANLTAVAGARAFINNANLVAAGNFGVLVGSGGSNVVPVWSNGTNWYIG